MHTQICENINEIQLNCTHNKSTLQTGSWTLSICKSRGLTWDVISDSGVGPTGALLRSLSSHWKSEFLGVVSGVGGRTEMSGTSVGENGSADDLVRPTVALSADIPMRMSGPQLSLHSSSSSSSPENKWHTLTECSSILHCTFLYKTWTGMYCSHQTSWSLTRGITWRAEICTCLSVLLSKKEARSTYSELT
jgi:hypothetical protein